MCVKFQDGIKVIDNKKRKKYWKKYYKKHKQEIYAKVKKWREKQKQYKIVLDSVDKYGTLVYEWINEKIKHFEKRLKKGESKSGK